METGYILAALSGGFRPAVKLFALAHDVFPHPASSIGWNARLDFIE